jgi:hypothetical protein
MTTPQSENDIIITEEVPSLLKKYVEHSNKEIDNLRKASFQLRSLESGSHAGIPLHCKGKVCYMAVHCPLITMGVLVEDIVGQPCPVEMHLMEVWSNKIMNELKIDPNNLIESSMARELAKAEIYQLRVSNRLAMEDFVADQCVGVDEKGAPVYRKELHIAAQWEDMIIRRTLKMREALLATRKSIADAGAGNSNNPALNYSNATKLVEKLRKESSAKAEAVRAELATPIDNVQVIEPIPESPNVPT